MEGKNVLEYPYTKMDIVLNKTSMQRIDLVNQRQIRSSQVNSILRSLNEGQHFDSMFVINVVNGTKRIRVLDGGHRTEALKKYFEQHPNDTVKVLMAVYKDLSEAEERAVYTRHNMSVKQSTDDFIHSYRKEIDVFDEMLLELPVNVYGSKTKMKIRYLVDAYLSSKHPFCGGVRYTRLQFLDEVKALTSSDVESMKDTFKLLSKIFNPKELTDFMRLTAFKITAFRALFFLVHFNKTVLGKNYVAKRMKTVLYNKYPLEQNKGHNQIASLEVYERFKKLLNDNIKPEHHFK